MKKIGVVTTQKVFAQSLANTISKRPELDFDVFTISDYTQAALDIDVLGIDVAVIDLTGGAKKQREFALALCEQLRKKSPSCKLLLLVSQQDKGGAQAAIEAKRKRQIDDFVFYDASLEYLYAKLTAI